MRIYPAIDILDKSAVRLFKGDYANKTVYSNDPLEIAITMEKKGANFLHVVDLDGAKNGKRINYFEFISSCENKDCNEALKRIAPRIDMNKINALIDETAPIADEHKLFLKTIMSARKELIIDFSYNKLRKTERLAADF